jgi:hypothetical protein
LWVIAISEQATVWLSWVVGACALGSLGAAKLARADAPPLQAAWPTALVGVLLFVSGVVALGTGGSAWLAAWSICAALALCGLAAAGLSLPTIRAFLRA